MKKVGIYCFDDSQWVTLHIQRGRSHTHNLAAWNVEQKIQEVLNTRKHWQERNRWEKPCWTHSSNVNKHVIDLDGGLCDHPVSCMFVFELPNISHVQHKDPHPLSVPGLYITNRLRVTETDNLLYLRKNEIRKTLSYLEGEQRRMTGVGMKEKALNDSHSTCSSRWEVAISWRIWVMFIMQLY